MNHGLPELLDARPKLRHDVVVTASAGGVLLRTVHATLHVRGRSAHRLLVRLSPHFDGERTLGEICARLDHASRRAVVELVGRLLAVGMVHDTEPLGDRTEPAALAHFRAQIEYLDHHTVGAIARFSRFRSARILLAGNGESMLASAICLLRNGAARLDLAPTLPFRSHAETLRCEVARLRDHGLVTTLRIDPALLPDSGHDLAVYCADRDDFAAVRELNRHCHAGGPPLVPLVALGNLGLLGPVVRRRKRGCWECAKLRFAASVKPDMLLPDIPSVARMLGSAAAFEAFRLLTGALPADTEGGVVIQNLRTLEAARESLLPHPDCAVCATGPPCGDA